MTLKQDIFLAKEWFAAHRAFGLWPDWCEFKRLRTAYQSEGRHYHTWQHIYECLKFVRLHYGNHPLVIFALFYHDVVYDIRRKDNEFQSAEEWKEYATNRGLLRHHTLKVKFVSDLILMTAGHKLDDNASLDARIMSDADMHVFLCPDHHYLEYAQGIWLEYHSVGREAYLAGRLQFLSTIDPDKMFYTHQAKAMVHHARANLDLEKTILESDPERILIAIV